ncbi:hypothetical protein BaRGS_00039179, partial [Batillaria attramentaria]
ATQVGLNAWNTWLVSLYWEYDSDCRCQKSLESVQCTPTLRLVCGFSVAGLALTQSNFNLRISAFTNA